MAAASGRHNAPYTEDSHTFSGMRAASACWSVDLNLGLTCITCVAGRIPARLRTSSSCLPLPSRYVLCLRAGLRGPHIYHDLLSLISHPPLSSFAQSQPVLCLTPLPTPSLTTSPWPRPPTFNVSCSYVSIGSPHLAAYAQACTWLSALQRRGGKPSLRCMSSSTTVRRVS